MTLFPPSKGKVFWASYVSNRKVKEINLQKFFELCLYHCAMKAKATLES